MVSMSSSCWSCELSQRYHLLCICQAYTLTGLERKDGFSQWQLCIAWQLEPQNPFMHAHEPPMQSPADALPSFKGIHKDLRSYQGIDGKRKPDAIIVSEVVVELPQILSLQAYINLQNGAHAESPYAVLIQLLAMGH